jgi:methylated-DNA-protein-cysteine methyltransferase-like protein
VSPRTKSAIAIDETPQERDKASARILTIVAAIPVGRVTTYGIIARHLHLGPRQVAKVLGGLDAAEAKAVPWFRVVAAGGAISSMKVPGVGRRQIARLKAEGVAVTPFHRVEDFRLLLWTPDL